MLKIRHVPLAAFCLGAMFATCFAQTPATFRTVTQSSGRSPRNVYPVDVNNDGILDIVQDTIQLPNGFTVSVANGDGTFTQKYSYQFPTTYQGTIPMASGDFNGDGKVDLVFELAGSNRMVLFLGKGDGTFQSPKYFSEALPLGQHFGGGSLLAADFSGDGKLDLVTEANTDSGGDLYLMEGDGKGNFGSPINIYSNDVGFISEGDFDGDGKADIAFLNTFNCTQGGCASSLNVLYNNGSLRFSPVLVYSFPTEFSFSSGDLNSDGRTDVFGTVDASGSELVVMYGQADRTFHTYTIAAPLDTLAPAMADFNGDAKMDLVAVGSNSNGQLVFFLAGSAEGMFTQQTYSLPPYGATPPVVGDFNSDMKPDVLVVGDSSNAYPTANSTIVDVLNTTSGGNWGGCIYPGMGMGITVCSPEPSTGSPVTFNASANSYGQLRKIELWVDGKKAAEQYHTWGQRAWFNFSDTIAPGTHRGVIFAADVDNRLQKIVFNFNVSGGSACSAPTSFGVKICMPASGSTVSSPVQVEAAATNTTYFARMELWIDGVKKLTSPSSTLNTSISLATGKHRFAVLAIYSDGNRPESAVYATVK